MFQNWISVRNCVLLLICFSFMDQVEAKQRILEVQSAHSIALSEHLISLASVLEPDSSLPVPVLKPEPPFTFGTSNTIYWNADSLSDAVVEAGFKLVAFDVQAHFDTLTFFSPTVDTVDSATFRLESRGGLPEGIPIEYQLRYFACDLITGDYAVSVWSEPEVSIQDKSPPVLNDTLSGIINYQLSGGKKWIIGKTVDLRVVATDGNGNIQQVLIFEMSKSITDTAEHPSSNFETSPNIDIISSFTLDSNTREVIILTWEVVDLALQHSNSMTDTVYIWPEEDRQDSEVICFPNPVQPDLGETVSIKTDVADIIEARIFDLFGNQITVLHKSEDDLFFQWDGRNEKGKIVARGGYLCVIKGKENLYCKIAVIR